MNKKLLATFLLTVLMGQMFAASFLIDWNGESIGERIDKAIAGLVL